MPGVPIFFFVSGLLIPASLEKLQKAERGLSDFFRNRFLRLYPALWVCLIVSVIALLMTGYLQQSSASLSSFLVWFVAQASFLQMYNPDFLRGYGTGVLNGSLWTIAVEIQFYVLTPLLLWLTAKGRWFLPSMLFFFMLINIASNATASSGGMIWKLLNISFLPWLYMFLLGYLFASSDKLIKLVTGLPILVWILAYVTVYYLTYEKLGGGNAINPLAMVFLCCLVLKAAFTLPDLSSKILGSTDLSYGLYIFHMPIVNTLLFLALPWALPTKILLAFLLSFGCAWLSWLLVESVALNAKKISSRKSGLS